MNKPPLLHKFPVFLKIITFGMVVLTSVILVFIFGTLLAFLIFGSDTMKNLALIATSTDPDIIALAKYFQIVGQFAIFLVPTVFFAFLDGRNIGKYLKINARPELRTIVFSVLAIIAVIPIINFIADLNQQMVLPAFLKDVETWMRESEDAATKMETIFLNTSTISGLLINILMMALIPAIGEEFLFRGVLQKLFHQWSKNIHVAVILSAFIFSAIHMQFYGFVPRFFLGIFLGYSFVWSGTLWVPIAIHFINNFIAVLFSYLSAQGVVGNFEDTIGTGDSALPAVIISTVLSTGFIYLIYHFAKKNKPVNAELIK